MEAGYEQVFSCDINAELVDKARLNFEGRNVQVLHHSSEIALDSIVSNITRRAVFFLDGHAMPVDDTSGEFGADTLQVGSEDDPSIYSPVIKEIEIIRKSSLKNHIILIDDRQCFGTWMFNDLTESEVRNAILKINPAYKFFYYENVLVATFDEIGFPKDSSINNSLKNVINRFK